jgi:UV DNA damage endonuclease
MSVSFNKPIQLGLCCINTILRNQKPPVFCSRKMVIKSIENKGIDELKSKITQNLRDVLTMMDWNEANGIKLFRLSSELFPHKSNPKVEDYDFDFAVDLLREIGDRSRRYNQRLTFHPGQYNVVGTPNKKCFEQTIADLKYHADVLDLMGLDQNSIMVVHGGGIYGNKSETKQRWCDQFQLLPENVKRRLVIENCEKCFSVEDCLDISERVNIPMVFDTHHYECYKKLHPTEDLLDAEHYIPRILSTWFKRQIKPKFHISEQGEGRVGHHSDYIETIPEYLLEIPRRYGVAIDIMVEAKQKEQAIMRLYNKYPYLNCLNNSFPDKLAKKAKSAKRRREKLIIVDEIL